MKPFCAFAEFSESTRIGPELPSSRDAPVAAEISSLSSPASAVSTEIVPVVPPRPKSEVLLPVRSDMWPPIASPCPASSLPSPALLFVLLPSPVRSEILPPSPDVVVMMLPPETFMIPPGPVSPSPGRKANSPPEAAAPVSIAKLPLSPCLREARLCCHMPTHATSFCASRGVDCDSAGGRLATPTAFEQDAAASVARKRERARPLPSALTVRPVLLPHR